MRFPRRLRWRRLIPRRRRLRRLRGEGKRGKKLNLTDEQAEDALSVLATLSLNADILGVLAGNGGLDVLGAFLLGKKNRRNLAALAAGFTVCGRIVAATPDLADTAKRLGLIENASAVVSMEHKRADLAMKWWARLDVYLVSAMLAPQTQTTNQQTADLGLRVWLANANASLRAHAAQAAAAEAEMDQRTGAPAKPRPPPLPDATTPLLLVLRIHRHAHADDERRARAARLLGWVSAVPGPLGEAVQKVIAYPAD